MEFDKAIECINDRMMPEITLTNNKVVVGYSYEENTILAEDPDTGKEIIIKRDEIKCVKC